MKNKGYIFPALMCLTLLAGFSQDEDLSWVEEAKGDRILRKLDCDPVRYARIRAWKADGFPNTAETQGYPLSIQVRECAEENEPGFQEEEEDIPGRNTADIKWKALGPVGGDVKGLAVNPKKSSEIFLLVSSSYSGISQIYRSINSGGKWKRISVLTRNGYDIALDPKNPTVVYVLGDDDLFKSTNSGKTWTELPLNPQYNYDRATDWGRICIHPGSPNTIYLSGSCRTSSNPYRSCMAVHKSGDGGKTWTTTKLKPGSDSGDCYALAISQTSPGVLYAGGGAYTGGKWSYSVFKSDNGGNTWKDVSGPINGNPEDIVIHPGNPNRAWVATYWGVYRTSDGGNSWQKNSGYVYAYALACHPGNPDTLYAGYLKTAYVSRDGGASWAETSANLYGDCYVMRAAGSTVLYGSSAGVYLSANQGTSWKNGNKGVRAVKICALTGSSPPGSTMYAEGADNGMFKSTRFGLGWKRLPDFYRCEDVVDIAVNPSDADNLYILAGG